MQPHSRITRLNVVWITVFIVVGIAQALVEYLEPAAGSEIVKDVFPTWITSWDHPIFLIINTSIHNPALDLFMSVISIAGTAFFPIALCVILYLIGRRREAILLLAAVILGNLIRLSIREFILRPRPYLVLPSAVIVSTEKGSGFPSGHSMTIFATASVLSKKLPRYRHGVYALAILVAISRIYLGVHFPFDVIVGSIIGWVSGTILTRFDTKFMSLLRRLSLA